MMCNRFEHRHGHSPKRCWRFLFGIPIFLGILALAGYVFMSLWNAVIPDVFGLKLIGFYQAVGLIIISRILFGGFHKFHRHHSFGNRPWDRFRKEGEPGAGELKQEIKID